MNLAKRMERLGTETAFEVLAKARKLEQEGKHIVHLEIGEPDFETADHIKNAAIEALNGTEVDGRELVVNESKPRDKS